MFTHCVVWAKKSDVAMYQGADWNNHVKTVSQCSPEKAKRISLKDPNISFFFFCRERIDLGKQGVFDSGDAVFFSGKPKYGGAPQCDSYEKENMTIVYINPATPEQLESVGCYKMADGTPAIDVACIFAANINYSASPYVAYNENILNALTSGAVKKLQDQGITVLLTILGNHLDAGWSCFGTESAAKSYGDYLISDVVNKYGLDGIDIDDEYSKCNATYPNSLVMVTYYMKQASPDSIVSKALFSDLEYFTPPFNGQTLADTLTYGWEMSYGGSPEYRLPPYVNAGMAKNKLSLGFWSNSPPANPAKDVEWLKQNGYEGVMMYAFESLPNVDLMRTLVNYLYGDGNWNKDPNCPN